MKNLFLVVACCGTLSLLAQKSDVSAQDREFTESALMENLVDVKFSEQALRKGFSQEVKDLAQRILADYKKADGLLRQLAAARSIAAPTQMDAEHIKDSTEFSDKVGEEFDRTYAEYMVKQHKKAIDLYEKENKKGENTELRAFATNALPGITLYKNMAEDTCKKLKKK